ncbi:MAG: enolase [Papillibacter sp.]|jgi:hypothetical protein|nr:enolase [Papillibacter sp.]
MEFTGITAVVAITVICYLVAMVIKLTPLDNKWLPVICGVLGGGLGVLSLYFMSGFPAEDIITAIAVGIVSGLAATGANQVYKQLVQDYKHTDTKSSKKK